MSMHEWGDDAAAYINSLTPDRLEAFLSSCNVKPDFQSELTRLIRVAHDNEPAFSGRFFHERKTSALRWRVGFYENFVKITFHSHLGEIKAVQYISIADYLAWANEMTEAAK